MLIKTLPVGQIEANCYIVTDENTLECAVIDPGDETNAIMDYIESNNMKVKAIFLTHGHYDHVGAAANVAEETGAPVFINEKDTGDRYKGERSFPAVESAQFYKEGDSIKVGSLEFKIIETPGHSLGSVTIMCEDALFTGDTLFRDSCGRTDLNGGDMEQMMASLRRLYNLEGEFEVYPGHMEMTSLSRERNFNYYMRYAVEQ